MDIFKSLFDTVGQANVEVWQFIVCVGVALVLGLALAFSYVYKTQCSKSLFITLSVLPAVVAVVIMMVNGNLGAGVAVAGAFSLVRFRSAPGTAKEISAIFIAMGTGLILGMGYVAYAVLFVIIMGAAMFAISAFSRSRKVLHTEKCLVVTIPEDVNYTEVFDEVLKKYTSSYELVKVKTTNLGSLFKLTYNVSLKNVDSEKQLIDEIRIRNGNLEVSVMNRDFRADEL